MSEFTSLMSSGSQAGPGTSETPVSSPSTAPAVTLRRVGPPTLSFKDQVQQYINLLTGVSDIVTLSNVEVVATPQIEPPDTPTEHELIGSQTEEDIMAIDGGNTNQPSPSTLQPEAGGLQIAPVDDGIGAPSAHLSQEGKVNAIEMPPAHPPFDHPLLLTGMNTENIAVVSPTGGVSPFAQFPPPNVSESQREPFHRQVSPPPPPPTWNAPLYRSASPPLPPAWNEPEERQIDCQACRESLRKPIFTTCGHAYCQECLNRLVRTGTANRAAWPPRCCGGRTGIEVEAIQHHLEEDVLIRYVTVSEEYSNRNPIYCANKTCSHYFEQTRVSSKQGKFIQCTECDTQTCTECKQNATEHIGESNSDCKEIQDLMTQEDQKLAQTKRWRQCPGCRNLVERIDGCSHMSCECGIDFCYDCGAKRDAFTTTCECNTRGNRHRRHQNPDGDNMPRRAIRRVLDTPIVPIPRRFRTMGEANPPDTATGTPQDRPAPVVPPTAPTTPDARTTLQANGPPDGTRTDSSPTARLSRPRHFLNLNHRQQLARTDTSNENRAGTPSGVTTVCSGPVISTQVRLTQTPDNGTAKKPAERPLRPRLKPQYDSSRPLFPVTQGPTVRTTPVAIQPMPPRKQPTTSRPTEIKTNAGEDLVPHPLTLRDKRSHSPDTTSQRRTARPSWMTNSQMTPFLSTSRTRSAATGISMTPHQQTPSLRSQRLPGLDSSYASTPAPSQ